MALNITKADVWAAEIEDQPGGLADKLDVLADAGASLEFVIARRQSEKPGTGVVFVTPIKGRKVQDAARQVGFSPADVATLRVEGPDRPGLGAKLCGAVADAGVNTRGVSAAVIGNKFVVYFGFDNQDDANRATRALKGTETTARKKTTKKATKKTARR